MDFNAIKKVLGESYPAVIQKSDRSSSTDADNQIKYMLKYITAQDKEIALLYKKIDEYNKIKCKHECCAGYVTEAIKVFKLKIEDLCDRAGCCTSQARGVTDIYFARDIEHLKDCVLLEAPECDYLYENEDLTLDEIIEYWENHPSCERGTCRISYREVLLDDNWAYNGYDLSKLKNEYYIKFEKYV
jgi:hypothetical protein